MTAPGIRAPGGAYEGAGRHVALAVRAYSSVVIVSDDVIAAAHVAIGIALAESATRLVMIGDLAGDVPPLQRLMNDDDPHGIYDSFAFGTSFKKVARAVPGVENFLFMPSGTDAPATNEILANARWGRFASEFAQSDELLLLVADVSAPGLDRLLAQMDGVVLVGLKKIDSAPDAVILARVPHPAMIAPPKIDLSSPRRTFSQRAIGLGAAALLAAGVSIGVVAGSRTARDPTPVVPAGSVADSAADDSSARPRPPVLIPVNPGDSANAIAFSIEVLASNTAEGADFEIQRHRSVMPGATVSLVPVGDTEATWYKVHAGAFPDSVAARRLLLSLRRRKIVPDSAGSIIRAPFALLVDSIASQGGMNAKTRESVQGLIARSVAAYALVQSDGSVKIYAGAFQNPEQSLLAATDLRVKGLTPLLAYRTGRIP